MTAEKKSKSKPSDRQRSPREQMAQDTAMSEPIEEKPPETSAWHEQAAFHVTLDHMNDVAGATFWQTHIYHEETGDERVQPGVLDQELIVWMRERAGLPAESLAEPRDILIDETPAAAMDMAMTEAARTAIGLSISALEILELPAERQAGGEETGTQLCARVIFDLAGPLAYIATADLTPYAVQVVAIEIGSAQAVLLASCSRALHPELSSYSETLDLELPEVGSYQLIANVVLSDHDAAAVALGPVLHVVP